MYLRTVMNIEKQISELLFEHDCVIVPDFGGFVCNISSASIHPSKHQFRPPYKKISFNRNLKNNDGLLANQIVQAQGITYTESNRLVSEYVQNLNYILSTEKRFVVNAVGTFYIGAENTLHFEQDETVNYLPDSFGLYTFNSPLIKREPIERKMERKLIDKVIVPSKEKTESAPSKRKPVRYALATAAVLLIAFFIWAPFQANLIKNIDYSSLNPFAVKLQPHYQPSDTEQPDPDEAKSDLNKMLAMASKDTLRYLNIVIDGYIPIVVQLNADETKVVKTKRKDSNTKNHFHIVGGAFAVSENAEKFYNKLIKEGYVAIIIDKKGNNLRFVSYGGFATKHEAMQALEKIRAVQPDAWLMTN